MKPILFFLILIGISNSLKSQFTSPGTGGNYSLEEIASISPTTVIKESSTKYRILQNITILEDSLVINVDNAEIFLDAGKLVTINGYFEAKSNNILFTSSDQSQSYQGFLFNNTSKILLQNTKFQYGGGIKCLTGFIIIDNCEFFKNKNGITTQAALDMRYSVVAPYNPVKPIIKNSRFLENENAAFYSNFGRRYYPQFLNNYVYKNGKSGSAQLLFVGDASSEHIPILEVDTTRIENNIILGDRNNVKIGGVKIETTNPNFIFSENIVKDNYYGLDVDVYYAMYDKPNTNYIDNNIFEYNNTGDENDRAGGFGLDIGQLLPSTSYPYYNPNPTSVSRNKIGNNYVGITYQRVPANFGGESSIYYNDYSIGQNVFYNNIRNNKEIAIEVGYKSFLPISKFNCWKEGEQVTDAMIYNLIYQTYSPLTPEQLLPRMKPYSCDFLNSDEIKQSTLAL